MAACCYAAHSKGTSDNADRWTSEQPRRSNTLIKTSVKSTVEGRGEKVFCSRDSV